MEIDKEITDYFNLYNSCDPLLISYKIWEEKYEWLPKNFDINNLETDEYCSNHDSIIGFVRTGIGGYTKMYFEQCDVCKQNPKMSRNWNICNNEK